MLLGVPPDRYEASTLRKQAATCICVCVAPWCRIKKFHKTHQDPSRPIKTPSPGDPLFYFPISFFPNVVPMIRTRRNVFAGIGMLAIVVVSPGRANAAGLAPASTVIREVSRNECVDLDSEKEGPIQSTHPKLSQTSVPDHPSRNKKLSNVADCRSFISF